MDSFKGFTVRHLRELARKHLGKGHSRLKTKDELIAALKRWMPDALKPARGERKVATAPKPKSARASAPKAAKPRAKGARPSPPPAEPLVEGFFVARVAGEAEARRHHMTEDSAPVGPPTPRDEEGLGELPVSYEDDSAVLLPRDPHTLFFFWDIKHDTRAQAFAELPGARAVLRVFDGPNVVRELDFAFESRAFYVHGLVPGRHYRVEAHVVAPDGRSKRVGPATNVVALPPVGPSSDTTVRYMRIPWDLPLKNLKQYLREGRIAVTSGQPRAPLDTGRHALPHSGSLPLLPPGEALPSTTSRHWRPTPSGHR